MTAVNTAPRLCRVLSLVILMVSVLVQVFRAAVFQAQIHKSAVFPPSSAFSSSSSSYTCEQGRQRQQQVHSVRLLSLSSNMAMPLVQVNP